MILLNLYGPLDIININSLMIMIMIIITQLGIICKNLHQSLPSKLYILLRIYLNELDRNMIFPTGWVGEYPNIQSKYCCPL